MNKTEKIFLYLAIGLVMVCSIVAIHVNGKKIFWNINIGQVLTILITGIVFFNITNVISSRTKKNDKFMELVEKLQKNLEDERIIHINSQEDVDFVKIRTRKLANIVNCMKSMEINNEHVEKHIEYIDSRLNDYEEITTNHINDIEHLKKSAKDLENKVELIDSRCDEIKVELYK